MTKNMDKFCESGLLIHLDMHFAGFMERLAGGKAPEVFLAAALISSYTRRGHICLDLSRIAGQPIAESEMPCEPMTCPELGPWLAKLRQSTVVGQPGEFKPLIIDERSRLYLHRYWDYQQKLADWIRRRAISGDNDPIRSRSDSNWYMNGAFKGSLDRLFPPNRSEVVDWQKIVAVASVLNAFCVISGGPGTGKTTTVAKIMALLVEEAMHSNADAGNRRPPITIALAAPTGKAAARLQESIKAALEKMDCPEAIKEHIPVSASTLHRLLKAVPGSPYFYYHAENPLPVDAVIVDEASMVDLALMSKLVQALPEHARLILLGDKDQLASVEAGAVLGDICDTGNEHAYSDHFSNYLKNIAGCDMGEPHQAAASDGNSGIRNCIVELKKSYRFGSESGIGALSRAVHSGEADRSLALALSDDYPDISWRDLPDPLETGIRLAVLNGYTEYLKSCNEPAEAFRRFEQFRILCALREGPFGASVMNRIIEEILKRQKLITPDKRFYRGRPVMITGNDYRLGLFNGDIGLVLPDSQTGSDLRVFFPESGGRFKTFHPLRLPEHETVYTMTVHKSQGSEFDKVLLLLPDRESPVLTRELIYTGITRAKSKVEIWGRRSVFKTAICSRIQRMSGLRDALWNP